MTPFYTFCLILLISCLLTNVVEGQKFNAFKSYKDAKIKPKHYGREEQRTHPIEEYLTSNQMKMMRARKGGDTADNSFDNNWSGFDTFKKIRQQRGGRKSATAPVDEGDATRRLDATEMDSLYEGQGTSSYFVLVGGLLVMLSVGVMLAFNHAMTSLDKNTDKQAEDKQRMVSSLPMMDTQDQIENLA